MRLWKVFALCLLLCLGSSAQAQDEGQDLDAIDIYLHTVNVGNLVYNNFGHTAIRVRNTKNGSDTVYNWGIFDFENPLTFALNFYRGILIYRLGAYPYTVAMRSYKLEERTVWEDKLFLSRDEKRIFLARLAWNMKPENRAYAYQYFFDNCSTRPRDYLDEALGGALSAETKKALTPMSFREQMIEGYQYNPGLDALLDLGMNSRLDRPMTQWERMFHPLHLRGNILEYSRSKKYLIGESHMLVEFPGPNAYPGLAHNLIFLLGGIPMALLGIGLFIQQRRSQFSKTLLRLFALFTLPWTFMGALLGMLMPLNWVASDHLDLHHNANMLLFWPLDFLLLWCSLGLLFKGRALRLSKGRFQFLQVFFLVHLLISLLLPTLRMFDVIAQNVDRVSVFILPPYLVIILLFYRVGVVRKED